MTAASLLAVAAVACAAAALVDVAAAARRGPSPARSGRAAGRAARGAARRERSAATPAKWLGQLARLGHALGAWAPSRGLEAKLGAAGLTPKLRAPDLMAAKVGAALAAPVAAAPFAAVLPGRLALASVAAAGCFGFLAPDLWLRRRVAARARALSRELPDVVELLRVAVDAGLPVTRALAEVGRRRRGLLSSELQAVARRVALGVPVARAIEPLPVLCPVDGVAALAAAIKRADRHGAALGPTLAALATRARAERARRVREQAARAAPKMQLVVALLLAPAVMLAVAAALAAAFVD